jgi:perosamine synthetase
MEELAINGGKPVSEERIPIAKPIISLGVYDDILEVLKSGYYCQGPKTKEFEDSFRERVKAKYAYATSSGTAALHIAYMSILNPGDEVIVPAFTFIATASTVILAGGRPVFVDVDKETLTIDTEDVKEKLTSKTKAITSVHLFGNAANMKALMEISKDNGSYLINDAAQAHGTEINGKDIGSYDDLNCYSFYPTKTITTGEGGIVTTTNQKLNTKGRLIRNHGQKSRYLHTTLGLNYRMTEIAAVIGLSQLKCLDSYLDARRNNAKLLTEGIKEITGLTFQKTNKNVNHSYSYYTIILNLNEFKCSRNQFVEALKAENIDCAVYYPKILSEQPILKKYAKNECPNAKTLSKEVFSIPVHPSLNKRNILDIIKSLKKVSYYYLK